jgi:uncharacterized membrane protein YfcA
MHIFLPIAQVSVTMVVLIGIGGVVGLLSGLFGVGGGFLLTPLLMFLGVSPMVAAASDSAAIVAAATTGTLQHSRVGTVDYRMGLTLFAGGSVGSVAGVALLHWLNRLGPANSVIRVLYVVMLGSIGAFMPWVGPDVAAGIYMPTGFSPSPAAWVDALPLASVSTLGDRDLVLCRSPPACWAESSRPGAWVAGSSWCR